MSECYLENDQAMSILDALGSLEDPIKVYKDEVECSECGHLSQGVWEDTTPREVLEESYGDDANEWKIQFSGYNSDDGVVKMEGCFADMIIDRLGYESYNIEIVPKPVKKKKTTKK